MRPEIDIPTILSEVVAPVVVSITNPGEVRSLSLAWGVETGPTGVPLELTLAMMFGDERFEISMWNVGEPVLPFADARARLESALIDFIAESRFAWGSQRLPRPR